MTRRPTRATPRVELLEERTVPATANLTAYRPVTEYFKFTKFRVAERQEMNLDVGPGIRMNRDDDNANGVADYLDMGASAGSDDDLVRVDVAAVGTATLAFNANLKVWTSQTKQQQILSGDVFTAKTVWVEYVGAAFTSVSNPAGLTLNVSDSGGTASDKVMFHTFRSVVVAIGGRGQNPANVGDPSLGLFTIATVLYQRGFDVHIFGHDQVAPSGGGSAYVEVSNAVKRRNVRNVAIIGYSWGGGATYELARGIQVDATLRSRFTLRYTAYIDAVTHREISSERRLPPGTSYHDNIFESRDWLIRGDSVAGASNVNVTNTSWGSSLGHTNIDDDPVVRSIIVGNLTARVAR
ncbi:MAG: hypothetical protein FJ271_04195 [Planctomycetes bacterium]|nr:hypothetical protein [Planctomycetota bacterium]